ncbi:MAG TPA: amidohydrolase family protein [Acidimicrobiia bacterium]|nr:amidohydrolase family protein [Acidimicrobiia bacterium]
MSGTSGGGAVTPGLVCAHHHLYSALARHLPGLSRPPSTFRQILEEVWWRLDVALDLEMIEWSAKLAALEALEVGTTAIIDHHESPHAIEGSLTVIADACAQVGVRVIPAYGVTDRHGAEGAKRGLAENERFLREGGKGMVGLHAAFTCSDETLAAAADLATEFGVGVHLHVCEGPEDLEAPIRLGHLTQPNWLLAHGVHLDSHHHLQGTIVHNPASNLNNAVGYADPRRFSNPVALGTDGIGADMLATFRLAHYLHRSVDVTADPEQAWKWLARGWELVPEAGEDRVLWSYEPMEPGPVAFTPGVRPLQVEVGNRLVWDEGRPTLVDAGEIRAKAREQAARLAERL